MLNSRLTRKRQATIPKDICAFLNLDSGDIVAFDIEKDKVVLRKSSPFDTEYLRSLEGTLAPEWHSDDDSNAYDGL